MPTEEAREQRRRVAVRQVVRYLKIVTAVVLVGFAYLLWQSFEGRVGLWRSTVAGCRRGKLDRAANASGWRIAEAARRRAGDRADLRTADRYARIAGGLEARARIDCGRAFPHPSLWPG